MTYSLPAESYVKIKQSDYEEFTMQVENLQLVAEQLQAVNKQLSSVNEKLKLENEHLRAENRILKIVGISALVAVPVGVGSAIFIVNRLTSNGI